MGRHRGSGGTRGISTGPLVVALTVALLVLATFAWLRLRDTVNDQAAEAAGTCVEGNATLHITADPLIAPTLTALADTWSTDTPRVIRDHCITTEVTASDTAATAGALAAGTWNTDLGPEPALWVPFDTTAADRATTATSSQRRSLATSPVVLAAPTDLAATLSLSDTGWADLPALQSTPAGLEDIGQQPWGTLRLALPTGPHTDATTAALTAVATAVAGADTGPATPDQVDNPAVVTAVTDLALGANALDITAGPTTTDALDSLIGHTDPGAPIHAVPVTDKQLRDTAPDNLTAFRPAGAEPVADFPAVLLDTTWVDDTATRAAAEFVDFIRRPEQATAFTAAGFRIPDDTPTGSILAPTDPAVADTLRDIRLHPLPPRKTTVLVDTTAPLDTTTAALADIVRRSPDGSIMGIYSTGGSDEPYRTAVARDALTVRQRAALSGALDGLTPTTEAALFPAIGAAYADAVANYDPTRPNSLLVVVASDDASAVTADAILDDIDLAVDPQAPVRIDVIVLGDGIDDTDTLDSVAATTGGSVLTIGDSTTDLSVTIRKLVS